MTTYNTHQKVNKLSIRCRYSDGVDVSCTVTPSYALHMNQW